MTGFIVLALIGYFVAKAYFRAKAARAEEARKKQIDHLYSENQRRMQERETILREQERERKEREREEEKLWKEQLRLRREQERQAKEQERQAAQLAKHEKRLADLEERMAVAEGEIEFQAQQIERLREHIEHAETERDACVYGSSRYYQWDKKCLALEKQIHTAESKMAKAQYIKTSAAKELAA